MQNVFDEEHDIFVVGFSGKESNLIFTLNLKRYTRESKKNKKQ